MCDLELDFTSLRLPEFSVPGGVSPDEYLTSLCWEGLESRIDVITRGGPG